MRNLGNDSAKRNPSAAARGLASDTPALDLWRRELAAGKRTMLTLDPLCRAARLEQSALEARSDGQTDLAARLFREARTFLRAALKEAAA